MSLRWYQTEAITAMQSAQDNGVIVLPTGSGKTHVIRGFCEQTDERVLILSHVQEILTQNFDKLAGLDDIGLWSAGLNITKLGRVTVAGIQSVHRRAKTFAERFDRILIDEAHLVSNEGMYKNFLTAMGKPYIGLTATDFRLKGGYIHGVEGMFDSKLYEAPVKKLTKEGWLCPLVYYGDKEPLNTEGIRVTGGDFNLKDMSLAFNRKAVTYRLAEQIARYKEYKHILVFCIDIEHAEQVAQALNEHGMPSAAVHSKSPRDEAIRKFKYGEIQALTNVNVLTTGFDFPAIDMIVILRPTKSMGLHQQMLGRGMRTDPSKTETLIKDFTLNTHSLGTVESPADLHFKSSRTGPGDPIMKTCPKCDKLAYPMARFCDCGHEFVFRHNLKMEAHQVVKIPKWYQVDGVTYSMHFKKGSPPMVKASYRCGLKSFTQYITLEHEGVAGYKAKKFLKRRYRGVPPTTASDLLYNQSNLKPPKRIQVDEKSKYPRIMAVV